MDEADDSLLVDKIGQTSSTIGVPELFVAVRYQGKFNTVLRDEFLNGIHIVVAYSNYFRIELFEFFQVTLEVSQFTRSDGAENGKIKSQNDMFLTGIVGQGDFSLGRRCSKGGCLVPCAESKRSSRQKEQAENQQDGNFDGRFFHYQTSIKFDGWIADGPALLLHSNHDFPIKNLLIGACRSGAAGRRRVFCQLDRPRLEKTMAVDKVPPDELNASPGRRWTGVGS